MLRVSDNKNGPFFNYLFWLFWVFSLTFLSLFFTRSWLLSAEAFLFFSMQALFFAFVFNFLEKHGFNKMLKAALYLLSLVFIIHLVGLFIKTLLDADIGFLYTMLFKDQAENFFVKMRAINVSFIYFILISLVILCLPPLFYFLYFYFKKISAKKLKAASTTLCVLFFSAFLAFAGFDFYFYKFNAVPSKNLLFSTVFKSLAIFPSAHKSAINTLQDTCSCQEGKSNFSRPSEMPALAENACCLKKPPIFLFVVESMRSDAINPKAAPALYRLKKEGLSCRDAYANANCTHMSWYSIFFAKLPWNWADSREQGAVPLKLLRQLGYKIEVFSSAELAYFGMKQKIFGKNLELANFLKELKGEASFQRDKKIFTMLKDKKFQDGTLYIIFLDSPHNEYDHPLKKLKFKPAANSLNYFKMACTPFTEAQLLKNRYLNCVNYLDSLFADFFLQLKKTDAYDKSLIIVTGDHGEEFYEEGAFFHGSHLSEAQIKIPLIYKIPGLFSGAKKKLCKSTSQVDIFPTVLQFLTGKQFAFFDGKSIFSQKSKKIFSFNQNGGENPKQFTVKDF